MESSDTRNTWLAVGLCAFIMWWFEAIFPRPGSVQEAKPKVTQELTPSCLPDQGAPDQDGPHVAIQAHRAQGHVNLRGGFLDSWTLTHQRQTLEDPSPINLLSMDRQFWAQWRWYSPESHVAMPDASTLWVMDSSQRTDKEPVTIRWSNGQGLFFEQVFNFHKTNLVHVTQRVTNHSNQSVMIGCESRIQRPVPSKKEMSGLMVYEGPLGYFNGALYEESYKDMQKRPPSSFSHTPGWAGFTDRFWLWALLSTENVSTSFHYIPGEQNLRDFAIVTQKSATQTLEPKETYSWESYAYLGAKNLDMLTHYEQSLPMPKLDLALDFGWLYILTKPMYMALTWLKDWVHNMGLAIMIITVLIKLVFLPITLISQKSTDAMKKLQPKIAKIKQQYKDDAARMQQEIMHLYRRHKANPLLGCLPMLLQIPFFFALYKVLIISIDMRHAPFFGWIDDLSAPDPTSLWNGFGLLPQSAPDLLPIGIWPILMGLTMVWQQMQAPPMNIEGSESNQKKIRATFVWGMPAVFTYMFSQFPSGLVIYWAWNNILTIIQQWGIQRYQKRVSRV